MKFSIHQLLPAAAAAALVAAPISSGDDTFEGTIGGSFFFSDTPCPARDVPTLESLAPVPSIIDPFEQDIIPVFCSVLTTNRNNPVGGVKGKFSSELFVLDNNEGTFETFKLDGGRFTTDSSGRAQMHVEIPGEIFADGFESGDVSAWSYTRVDLKKKKKLDAVNASCSMQNGSSQ